MTSFSTSATIRPDQRATTEATGTAQAGVRAFQAVLGTAAGKACASGTPEDIRAALEDLVIQGELEYTGSDEGVDELSEDLERDDVSDVDLHDPDGDDTNQADSIDPWDHGLAETPIRPDAETMPAEREDLFEIVFMGGRATFTPPVWIGSYTPRKGSGIGWGCLALLAKRIVLFTELAAWLQDQRPDFVATFDLRHWCPLRLEDLIAGYVPNCLHAGVVQALNARIAYPYMKTSESYFSRMAKKCVLVHESGSAMPLDALFSQRAKTVWAASMVCRFMTGNGLPGSELERARHRLRTKGRKNTDRRRQVSIAAMRLEDFILFIHKPFGRKVGLDDIICEAELMARHEERKQ